jgi:anaerobic ribonucleoside-triphosphate reductase activating protein
MKIRLAAYLQSDSIVDGEGIRTVIWTQGCPHHCLGCHNPETWDFNGGKELPSDIRGQIIKAICANGITRNFSILGGEPLCKENLDEVNNIIISVRTAFPHIKIFMWTGYTLEELKERNDERIENILSQIDVLIDGPFIESERDITLNLCGSKNQRVLYRNVDF